MTPNSTETLKKHLSLCDEVHQLALEENRFLKQHQRPPEAALLERKRALLTRLDESLNAIKAINAGSSNLSSDVLCSNPSARPDPEFKTTVEKARAKILQILHLDRENEQLLLRYSLGTRPNTPVAPATPHVSQVQRIYDRHSSGA